MQLAWKILVGLSVVFGVVTGVATVAKWDWAYPVPLLLALGLLALGLGVALIKMQHDHSAEMTKARQGDAAELAEARQQHATELAEARQRQATELAEAREQHATELAEARNHRADELTAALQAADTARGEAERYRAILAETKIYADEQARAHDERLFAETRRLVPRTAVRWLREHDFNGSWRAPDHFPFMEFYDNRRLPELTFNDPELEARRQAFSDANDAWVLKMIEYSSALPGGLQSVRQPLHDMPPEVAEKRWQREANELNALADTVGEAYDALIDAGRARGFDLLGDA